MATVTRKYIITPTYAPLYAARKCWGPEHGPLNQPTLFPVDIIGELLKQTGSEKVELYEVKKDGARFTKPVRLTLKNYKLSYDEIVNGVHPVNLVAPITPPEAVPVEPIPEEVPEEEEVEETPAEEDPLDELAETAQEELGDQAEVIEPAGEIVHEVLRNNTEALKDQVDEEIMAYAATDPAVEEPGEQPEVAPVDPYAGMSKSQRKKARREEAARKAAEEALATQTETEE